MRKNVVIGIIITVVLVMSSQVLAAESNQGGWSMDSIEIKSVPAEYRRAVPRNSVVNLEKSLMRCTIISTHRASLLLTKILAVKKQAEKLFLEIQ